jgi:hypothetical protein
MTSPAAGVGHREWGKALLVQMGAWASAVVFALWIASVAVVAALSNDALDGVVLVETTVLACVAWVLIWGLVATQNALRKVRSGGDTRR